MKGERGCQRFVQVLLHRREHEGDEVIAVYAERAAAVRHKREIEDDDPATFINPDWPKEEIIIKPCRVVT